MVSTVNVEIKINRSSPSSNVLIHIFLINLILTNNFKKLNYILCHLCTHYALFLKLNNNCTFDAQVQLITD